jgi:hypothetical protein
MNKFALLCICFISLANHNPLLPGWSWKEFGKGIIKGYELPWFNYTVDLSPQNGLPTEDIFVESASYQTQVNNPHPTNIVRTPEGKTIPVVSVSLFNDFPQVNSVAYRAHSPKNYIFFKRNSTVSRDNQTIKAEISYTVFPLPILLSISLVTSLYFNQTIRDTISSHFNQVPQDT